jgi:hypothetical protein
MTDLNLERILASVHSLTPAQKIQVAEAMLPSAPDMSKLDRAAAAKCDPVLAAAADNPELIARIHAGRGEARRIGVAVDSDNRIDVLALNKALDALGWHPEKRMASKRILAIAGMIP